MGDTTYADAYRNTNFREHPELYKIGRGEQGVLMAEPYKSEILPYWKFKTPEIAQESAAKIYELYENYKKADDFVGMDMSRKFLQMGFTRSRRYANHSSGNKYDGKDIKPQDAGHAQSPKAKSAEIFLGYYRTVIKDDAYVRMKKRHMSGQ